jgi:hypothetical protein
LKVCWCLCSHHNTAQLVAGAGPDFIVPWPSSLKTSIHFE